MKVRSIASTAVSILGISVVLLGGSIAQLMAAPPATQFGGTQNQEAHRRRRQ